ncbi:MAG: chemotaxis protein CheA [Gammaproteobacteria bacterium]|nr:MAG: chemotaxis protein CheA [Gammaproteobacteria bacterium]RLA01273.1 MAG: chemotaxis protein CheA [Gammaproteobacteria bacterium]
MALDTDDEILQDFLVEAEELMEGLNEQLVELENQPEDSELLNSIFRGFHTIKGGAGFLSLDAMVALCHKCEDLFNILRQGERIVDADMMDTFLKVTDSLTIMFDEVKSGEYPAPADPDILEQLAFYLDPNATPTSEPEPTVEKTAEPESPIVSTDTSEDDDITDDEFEALLDELHGAASPAGTSKPEEIAPPPSDSDDITDDEFEALLDQLHGPSSPGKTSKLEVSPEQPASDSGDITDDEFEALLDQLQGKKPTQAQPPPASEPQAKQSAQKIETAKVKQEPTAKATSTPKQAETSVRVDTSRLDDIMNMVGELVLVRNRISTLEAALEDEEMAKAVNNLAVVTADLQTAVMKTRMQPIKKVFGRFPRVVRDLARSLKKEINLELRGEETDLDKNLVEALADPLVHLVRNAVDHGIEMPDTREQSGKSPVGQVILGAAQEGDHILLTISDDGAGMDADVLRQKAVEKGMMDEESASRLTDSECYALIFAPGFSMKKEISDISGRGVGMDVVKTSISKLNGVIEITSEIGKGTTLSIKVPLTLAIMPTLMVMLGDQIFAFPLVNVNEIFHLDLKKTNIIDGQQTINVRNKALPLFYLRKWLANTFNETETPEIEHVVIVNVGTQRVGFVVDQLIGQEEVVIKPLGAMLQGTKGLSGATITGDGRISLIIDFPELMNNYALRGY